LKYYGLNGEPFHITPDPEFLFLSPSHREALASIVYGVQKRKGFVSIVGEVGTGKTTILRSFLESTSREQIKPLYIFDTNVSFKRLLENIFRELGIVLISDDEHWILHHLHQKLIEEYRQNRNIVLVIDEAQNMPKKTLENLRMLSNLETSKDKLLQIILAGQPELQRILDLHELRQLKQRIAVRVHLRALTDKESREYIQHRLSKVRDDPIPLFRDNALRTIVHHARGNPRIINILCDNALIAGYAYQEQQVTEHTAKQVIKDYESDGKRRWFGWRVAGVAAVVLLGVSVAALFFKDYLSTKVDNWVYARTLGEVSEVHASNAAVSDAESTFEEYSNEMESTQVERVDSDLTVLPDKETVIPDVITSQPEDILLAENDSRSSEENCAAFDLRKPVELTRTNDHQALEPNTTDMSAVEGATSEVEYPGIAFVDATEEIVSSATTELTVSVSGDIPASLTSRVINHGDCLSDLCLEVYGKVDFELIERIKRLNPQIQSINRISVGDTIVYPAPDKVSLDEDLRSQISENDKSKEDA